MEQLSNKKNVLANDSASINDTTSRFVRSWTMILAANASGVSLVFKNRQRKDLESRMQDFGLLDYPNLPLEQQKALETEWTSFANYYISTCIHSKSYCSTLFGMVPVKDHTVLEKLSDEIDLVTRRYPAHFQLDEAFLPLRNVFKTVYQSNFPD